MGWGKMGLDTVLEDERAMLSFVLVHFLERSLSDNLLLNSDVKLLWQKKSGLSSRLIIKLKDNACSCEQLKIDPDCLHNESESKSCSVESNILQLHGLYSPWNFPGQNTGVGRLSLLQGIFLTQGSNPGLLYRRRILYQLSYHFLHYKWFIMFCCKMPKSIATCLADLWAPQCHFGPRFHLQVSFSSCWWLESNSYPYESQVFKMTISRGRREVVPCLCLFLGWKKLFRSPPTDFSLNFIINGWLTSSFLNPSG